jgi:hypothetical protein
MHRPKAVEERIKMIQTKLKNSNRIPWGNLIQCKYYFKSLKVVWFSDFIIFIMNIPNPSYFENISRTSLDFVFN